MIEINQASALAGVGLGDAPGFPITLALRGCHRLAGALDVPAGTTATVRQNDRIHVDLNGSSITGGGGASSYGVFTAADSTRGRSLVSGNDNNAAKTSGGSRSKRMSAMRIR